MSLPIKIENFLLKQNTDLIHLETVGSTMKEIKKHIGDKDICLIADEQTEGIGRRGNQWVSPKGNIYLSFLFKCNLSIEHHFLFTAVAANSIILCLNNYINENIYIKCNPVDDNGNIIDSKSNNLGASANSINSTLEELSSTFNPEFGIPTLEAMSCGLPIIYSASGGIPELVDKHSGVGLEVDSSWSEVKTPKTSKIVDGMKKIIENKKLMSEAARVRAVENFDIKFWKKRHEIIFDYFLNKK